MRNQAGLAIYPQPLSPHSGNKCSLGYLHTSGTNTTSDERLRGNFDAPLQQGAYEFSAYFAALDNNFGADADGYLEFWLINSNNACGAQDRMIMEVYYLPDAIWDVLDTCFAISHTEAGLYDRFEFRMRPGPATNVVHSQLLVLDDINVSSITYIPGFADLGLAVCTEDLILDVSQLGDYTILIYPGNVFPCGYQGNGQVQPTLDLRSFCDFDCDSTWYTLSLSTECSGVAYTWGKTFQVACDPVVDLGQDIDVCANAVPPTIQAPPGFANYTWTLNGAPLPCPSFPNASFITACQEGTYCVTVTNAAGCTESDCIEVTYSAELVQGGDMEAGNTFTSDLDQSCAPDCGSGTYCLVQAPVGHCPGFTINVADRTNPGTGNFMSIDGSTFSNQVIWAQDVTVDVNTGYWFSMYIHYYGQANGNTPPNHQIRINGQVIRTLTGFPGTNWFEVPAYWYSTVSGPVTVEIVQTNRGYSGYDYAIDDISLVRSCCEPEVPAFPGCQLVDTDLFLSWQPVDQVISYEYQIYPNDPSCGCKEPVQFLQTFVTTDHRVGPIPFSCFSWRVRAVCPRDNPSPWSAWTCYNPVTTNCISIGKTPHTQQSTSPFNRLAVNPNPANPAAKVQLTLGAADFIELEVWDLRGQLLTRIPGKDFEAGEHQFDFLQSLQLPQGSYFLKATGKQTHLSSFFSWYP